MGTRVFDANLKKKPLGVAWSSVEGEDRWFGNIWGAVALSLFAVVAMGRRTTSFADCDGEACRVG